MEPIHAAVVPVDAPPPAGAQLVVFADSKAYTLEAIAQQMLSRAVRYARKHRVYLVPQRFMAGNFLCLCLLSPEGAVLGAQRATHLNLDYRAYRFRRESAITPFDTPIGRVALLVDVDVAMPHVVRQAVSAGAELLLSSCFIQPFDLNSDRVRETAEAAAHANGVSLVGSMSGYGLICPPDGEAIVSSFEDSPIAADVLPAPADGALRAEMADAEALLRRYRRLFTEIGGEEEDV